MAKVENLVHVIRNLEAQDLREKAGNDPNAAAMILSGDITTNGEPRKTSRLVITNAMRNRPGFGIVADPKARTATVTIPSERTGRRRKTGTDLTFLMSFAPSEAK